jgi:thiopeptide-type bacteriocin biosynthesis protein
VSVGWHSIHVYYHADHDPLLLACLEPLLARPVGTSSPLKLFFIRHWQGGPHVRLRVLAEDSADSFSLEETVGQFLLRCPSESNIDERAYAVVQSRFGGLEASVASAHIWPNNTVRREPYHPEYGKYGGESGVAMAEDLFVESTRVSIAAIRGIAGSSNRRLGFGFTMFLSAALAFGLAPREVAVFAAAYERAWSSYITLEIRARWDRLVESHLPALRGTAERILCGAVSPLARPWAEAIEIASRQLEGSGTCIFDAMELDMPRADKRRMLLMQYIHTHNNRLGIDVDHEAYLCHMVRACLDQLGLSA